MKDKRFSIGLFLTAAWLMFAIGMFFTQKHPTDLNAWGDFFAGFFAPLAFLWLVLGYMQQGEELRHSTEALRLQAEELRNSVEQQRELVEVTRLQVDGEREALVYERRQREEGAKPSFAFVGAGGSFRGDGQSTYSFVLSNSGNAATELVVDFFPPGELPRRVLDVPLFERGKQQTLNYESAGPLEGTTSRLLLSFKDILGKQYEVAYTVQRKTDHPHSPLSFIKVEPDTPTGIATTN